MIEQVQSVQRVITNIIERGGTQGAAKESLGTVPASYTWPELEDLAREYKESGRR